MIFDSNEIMPGKLWIGSYPSPADVEQLRRWNIVTVISLQSDEDLSFYGISTDALKGACADSGISYRRVPIRDFNQVALAGELTRAVDEVARALENPEARAYLHCTAGINRAPTVGCAYLIRWHGKSALEAYQFVTARRHCRPYFSVLLDYTASLRKQQKEERE